jgi:hypothetical protein
MAERLVETTRKRYFLHKIPSKIHFFTKIFGQFKKKQYLCSRFREKVYIQTMSI